MKYGSDSTDIIKTCIPYLNCNHTGHLNSFFQQSSWLSFPLGVLCTFVILYNYNKAPSCVCMCNSSIGYLYALFINSGGEMQKSWLCPKGTYKAFPGHSARLDTTSRRADCNASLLCFQKPHYIFKLNDYSQTKTTRKNPHSKSVINKEILRADTKNFKIFRGMRSITSWTSTNVHLWRNVSTSVSFSSSWFTGIQHLLVDLDFVSLSKKNFLSYASTA
jgi:hypothetical protein